MPEKLTFSFKAYPQAPKENQAVSSPIFTGITLALLAGFELEMNE